MQRRVLILSAGIGSGHNMAAQALEQAFSASPDVAEVQNLDMLTFGNDLYRALYSDMYFKLAELVPWLVSWGYDYNTAPFRDRSAPPLWDLINAAPFVQRIREYQPDVTVCTHYLPAKIVALLLAQGTLQTTLSVVTTDYDFQGLWLCSLFNRFFVARDETWHYLTSLGLPPERVSTSGIPVPPALGTPVDRAAVLDRYKLRADQPIILVSAGAAGGEYATSAVAQLVAVCQPFQAVVVCGRNAELKQQIDQIVAPHADRFRVLGYTTDMPDLMRVARLFIGKPGGLTSAECMTAGLPMLLINPLPGQEELNSDYLLEEGAAMRCNYRTTLGFKVARLLADPARLDQMATNARRIGQPQAAQAIVATTLHEPTMPLQISSQAQSIVLQAAKGGATLPRERNGQLHRLRRYMHVGMRTAARLGLAPSASAEPPAAVPATGLVTLTDQHGASIAIITHKQFQTLRAQLHVDQAAPRALTIDQSTISMLGWWTDDVDLVTILRRAVTLAGSVAIHW